MKIFTKKRDCVVVDYADTRKKKILEKGKTNDKSNTKFKLTFSKIVCPCSQYRLVCIQVILFGSRTGKTLRFQIVTDLQLGLLLITSQKIKHLVHNNLLNI